MAGLFADLHLGAGGEGQDEAAEKEHRFAHDRKIGKNGLRLSVALDGARRLRQAAANQF
jgi:hypothetical protein